MKTQTSTMQQNSLKKVWIVALLLVFGLMVNPMNAQNTDRTVTGVVSSLDGPLLGATVVLKGTTVGITSNESGAFTFPKKLKENDVLQVSYLGYKTREVVIKRATTFIEPFLEDIAVVIHGALRTEVTAVTATNEN